MTVRHVFSNAIADGTNTQIVRPVDWNSAHNFTQNLDGNTVGAASVAGTNIVWAGGNNVTLSGDGASVTISGPHTSQFLTTAALSNHSHGNPTLALTNLTGTTASNSAGLTLSLSAGDLTNFLTTAALSNHSHGNPTLALTNISGTTASNSAGLTLSLSAANPGAGGGQSVSATQFVPAFGYMSMSNFTLGQNTLGFYPFDLSASAYGSVLNFPVALTNSSTGSDSGQVGYTLRVAIYTQHASDSTRMQTHYTTSYTLAASNSSNVSRGFSYISGLQNSTSYLTTESSSAGLNVSTLFHGSRELQVAMVTTLGPGRHWLAVMASSSLAGTSNGVLAVNHMIYRLGLSNAAYPLGVALNNSSYTGLFNSMGMGIYGTTTGAFPDIVAFTDVKPENQHYPLVIFKEGPG